MHGTLELEAYGRIELDDGLISNNGVRVNDMLGVEECE